MVFVDAEGTVVGRTSGEVGEDDLAAIFAALAAAVAADDAPELARRLFGPDASEPFVGNPGDYADPRNSFLDQVLDRRLGIPISLSVLMIEVGRRRGIPLVGVGMPGHFLVGCDDGFVDPFHGGTVLDAAGARRLFDRAHPGAPFADHYLDPVGPRSVLSRMLANLVATYMTTDPMRAIWALRLRLGIPGLPGPERRQGEAALARLQARLN
jgi:regulator of sirC expression with transglutaminase-like and TPR domain